MYMYMNDVCMHACDDVQFVTVRSCMCFSPKDIGVNCTQLTFCEKSPKLK